MTAACDVIHFPLSDGPKQCEPGCWPWPSWPQAWHREQGSGGKCADKQVLLQIPT